MDNYERDKLQKECLDGLPLMYEKDKRSIYSKLKLSFFTVILIGVYSLTLYPKLVNKITVHQADQSFITNVVKDSPNIGYIGTILIFWFSIRKELYNTYKLNKDKKIDE